MAFRLAHTMIRVRDIDRSLAFYVGFLGLREVRRKEIGEEATLVFLADASGAYHLELTHNKDGREYTLGDQFGHLALIADDLDSVIEDVQARGWAYRGSKKAVGSRYIFVKDPDGYDVEILAARPA